MDINTAGVAGIAAAAPEKHRNLYGRENVYALWLDISRDSGVADRVLVLFQEDKINGETYGALPSDYMEPGALASLIKEGSRVEATGTVQTYKDKDTGRTQLFIWGLYLANVSEHSQQLNIAYVMGTIAKQPTYRETPKGKRITDITVRIPSAFTPGFYSYIPCITWEKLAEQAAGLQEGQEVYLEGRIQSRDYVKKNGEESSVLTTWEISANKLQAVEKDCSGCACPHCAADCMLAGCSGYPSDAPQESKAEELEKCYRESCQHYEMIEEGE